MGKVSVGVDVGGTNTKLVLLDSAGKPLAKEFVSTPRDGPKSLVRIVREFVGAAKIHSCGIGLPGVLDRDRRELLIAVNLRKYERRGIRKIFTKRLGVPAIIENDANAAAFGEFMYGAGRGSRAAVLYTLGTGIGGGVVLDGKLITGAGGGAGELGHVKVVPDGEPCPCGKSGCVESYASASGITRAYKRASSEAVSAKEVFARARRGDKRAGVVISAAVKYLGIAVANIIATFEPDVIIFAGGISNERGLIARVKSEAAAQTYMPSLKFVRFKKAKLGDFAGAIGAAALSAER